MASQLYQPEGKDHDQPADEAYDEALYHVPPAFPATHFISPPANPPGYSMFHPGAWQSDMNGMVFMDALQSWTAPPTITQAPNDPRPVSLGVSWQQQSSPLTAWDMFGPDMAPEPPISQMAPARSPYPVHPDSTYECAVFIADKSLDDTWDSGWMEKMPSAMDTATHPVGAIPQAIAIGMPVERPIPAHAARKRRRVPSPTNEIPVYTTPMAHAAMRSSDTAVPMTIQPLGQQQTVSSTARVFFTPDSPTPPAHPFQLPKMEKSHAQELSPQAEEMPEHGTMNPQSHSTPSPAMPQSPSMPAQLLGPVAGTRAPASSKVRRGTNAVFKTQSANSKRGHYASDVWEGHKATIRKLYIDEGKPLREVIRIMETEHNFPATQRMYKARFKQWGFVKNNTEKVVSQILRTKFERDAAGKLSHFTRNGKDVNLQNYLQRKGLTEYDLVDLVSSADSESENSSERNGESDRNKDLLAHVRCRTPPTDVPINLRLPDRLRFQDTLVMSFKRAFLLWRQEEQEKEFGLFQPSVFTWRVTDFPHLSNLIASAKLIRSGDSASGIAALNQAFWSMNGYLTSMDATGSFYFFFHRQSRPWQEEARIALAVWKFLAAYASSRNHNNHPLFHTFKLMYEVIQKEGTMGLRSLLMESSNTIADELERAFGREHWLKDLIWHRCFPEKSKLRSLQLIRDMRDQGPTKKFVKRLY